MVFIGMALIFIGIVLFGYALVKVFLAFTVSFWKEKWIDKYLFSIWRKQKDYKRFKNNIK